MFKSIIDENIYLRLLNESDTEELFNLIDSNRQHLKTFLPWVDYVTKEEDTKQFIRASLNKFGRSNGFDAVIIYKGKIAGIIGLHNMSCQHKNTSIGYWLGKEFEGRGIMTKSCEKVLDYLFNELHFKRVEIRCATKNFKSQAIPKRLGLREEGVLRQVEFLYGDYVDHIVYSMIK